MFCKSSNGFVVDIWTCLDNYKFLMSFYWSTVIAWKAARSSKVSSCFSWTHVNWKRSRVFFLLQWKSIKSAIVFHHKNSFASSIIKLLFARIPKMLGRKENRRKFKQNNRSKMAFCDCFWRILTLNLAIIFS